MGRMGWIGLLPAVIASSLQPGCSSSTEPAEPNLKPVSVSVVTSPQDVQAAHGLDVEVGIFSVTTLQGVGVAFRAFPKAQWDVHDENIESWLLGSSAYDVPAGGGTYAARLQIPYEVPAGEYYVVPEVDPLDTIAETDETDQYGVTAPLVVNVEHRDHPRLMIEEAVLDVPAFELSWLLGAAPDPLGLTVLVRVEGNAPLPDAEIAACVRGPQTPCVALPLGIWDSTSMTHVPQHVVPELLPGEPTSVHLDLAFGPELEAVLDGLLADAATACLSNVVTCAEAYGMVPSCAEDGVSSYMADPNATGLTLQASLLKCIPFTVEATIDAPAAVLFDPLDADPGRSITAELQLLPPPPLSPIPESPITMWPLVEPVVRPELVLGLWYWDPVSIEFAADKSNCIDPVLWSVELEPDPRPGSYTSAGTIVGTDLVAEYFPPLPSDPNLLTTKVVVEASACGATASATVTLIGRDPSVTVAPVDVAVEVGAAGYAEFTAVVKDCPVAPDLVWTLDPSADPRLTGGVGTIEKTGDLTARYLPPTTFAFGAPVPVTLRATAQAVECPAEGRATIAVGLAKALTFEKAYVKEFANDLFGAGVDLFAGGYLDRDGGRAEANARVPVKVFGQGFDLLNVTNHASVDPRPAGEAHLIHRIDAFGVTVNSIQCPGDPLCSGTAQLWSDSRCVPNAPPQVCAVTQPLDTCARSTECSNGLRCMNKHCTKPCDSPADCNVAGLTGACPASSPLPSPHKKVFVIVVVPVTLEGKICADYGLELGLNLLEPIANEFSATLGPFFEVGGYASAAVGYTGLLAVGAGGELVLVRDDFYGKVAASIELAPQGADCPYAAGCIQGSLRESIENVLQGGKGKVYVFADYPTLKWCRWYPCIGTARATQTLASWGSLFEIRSTCDWCVTGADCPIGVACVDGMCADGLPGVLCREQHAFVSAE